MHERKKSVPLQPLSRGRAAEDDSLTDYMSSGPVVCSILEGEDAIHRYRELMGATNPEKAAEGTNRKKYAVSLEANSVHGSDAPETAAFETRYFFSAFEIV